MVLPKSGGLLLLTRIHRAWHIPFEQATLRNRCFIGSKAEHRVILIFQDLETSTQSARIHTGVNEMMTRFAVHTVEALQAIVAPFTRLDRIASTAWTLDAVGPAQLSQVISGFLVIYQVWYQVFHGVAPMELKQPHYTDTAWLKLL